MIAWRTVDYGAEFMLFQEGLQETASGRYGKSCVEFVIF